MLEPVTKRQMIFRMINNLRGIYFSSALQQGTPHSRFADAVDLPPQLQSTIEENGFFLHDFFAKVLPRDRTIFAPTRRALRADHKTVFAVLSWLTFGWLLAGRLLYGWRGRTALRWTLTGFVLLVFAYVGSRFVLEVVLQRT